jgi:hypothetical protein
MEDAFMQIVREKLREHDFLESQNNPGLFFNSFMVADRVYFVDVRHDPIRLYGYLKIEGQKDVPIDNREVEIKLHEVKKMLVTIGCKTLEKF